MSYEMCYEKYTKMIEKQIYTFEKNRTHYRNLLTTEFKTSLTEETKKTYQDVERNYTQAIVLLKKIKPLVGNFVWSVTLATPLGEDLPGMIGAKAIIEMFDWIGAVEPNLSMAPLLKNFLNRCESTLKSISQDIQHLTKQKGQLNKAERIGAAFAGVFLSLGALVSGILKALTYPIFAPIFYSTFDEVWCSRFNYPLELFREALSSFKSAYTGYTEPLEMKALERDLKNLTQEIQTSTKTPFIVCNISEHPKPHTNNKIFSQQEVIDGVRRPRASPTFYAEIAKLDKTIENRFFPAPANLNRHQSKQTLKTYWAAVHNLETIQLQLAYVEKAALSAWNEVDPSNESLGETKKAIQFAHTILLKDHQTLDEYHTDLQQLAQNSSAALGELATFIQNTKRELKAPERVLAALYGLGYALASFVILVLTIIFAPIWAKARVETCPEPKDKYYAKDLFLASFDAFKSAWIGQKEPPKLKELEREMNALDCRIKEAQKSELTHVNKEPSLSPSIG